MVSFSIDEGFVRPTGRTTKTARFSRKFRALTVFIGATCLLTFVFAQELSWSWNNSGPDGTGWVDDPVYYYPSPGTYRIPIATNYNPNTPTLALLSHDATRYIGNAFDTLVNSKLPNLSPTCNANVVQKLHDARGFYTGDFVRYLLLGHHFFYGDDSTVPTKGVVVPSVPPTLGITVRDSFKNSHNGVKVQILTSALSPTLLVFFTRDAIHDDNSGNNPKNWASLFHEGLHGFTVYTHVQYYDSDLQQIFGLPVGGATVNISDYIRHNCFE